MRITLTVTVLALAGTALTILWKPYKPAQASDFIPEITEPEEQSPPRRETPKPPEPKMPEKKQGGDVLACIRRIESGGDYSTDTGNGYKGAYQFTDSAWRANFGDRTPSQVSPAEQDALALNYISRRGLQPWPKPNRVCR